MATKIILKKSSVAGNQPTTSDIDVGEVALNLADKKLYSKDGNNNVIEIGSTDYQTLPIKADVAITKGTPLYATGAVGNSGVITVNKFIANNTIDELYLIGVAEKDFAIGDVGKAVSFGEIKGINTTGSTVGQTWTNGSILYASPSVAGVLTNVAPTAPNLTIPVAMVINAHATNGILFIRPSNGFHLSELHDVAITSIASGELLKWDGTKWINNTLAEAGIQPSGSYLTSNQTITLSGDLTGSGTTAINAQIAANVVGANELNVVGNGTTAQYLRSDGDGTFTWATPPDTNTTYAVGNGGLTEINFTSALNTKLAGIEAGATADQTATEILTAIKTVDGTGSGLDADLLDGQHGSYYTGYADTAVANLVASAPSTLDTLNELAAALGDDPNFATTVTNNIATKVSKAGDTMTGDLSFGDNDKAVFGAGSDLQIYHSGSNSHITEGGTGNLIIRADDFRVQSNAGEEYIAADANGAVSLRYDNTAKLSTTSTGVDVTGTITSDGLTVARAGGAAGSGNVAYIDVTSSFGGLSINSSAGNNAFIEFLENGVKTAGFNSDATANVTSLQAANGHALAFNTDGTTERMRITSTGSVGIGNSSPDGQLTVGGTSTSGDISIRIKGDATSRGFLMFGDAGGAQIGDIMYDHSDNHMRFRVNNSERMRIDGSGNVGIGTTSPTQRLDVAGNIALTGTVDGRDVAADGTKLDGIEAGATAGGGAVGGGNDKVFWENDQVITTNYTITNGKNAGTFGPITINSGVTVTVGDGETWTVI